MNIIIDIIGYRIASKFQLNKTPYSCMTSASAKASTWPWLTQQSGRSALHPLQKQDSRRVLRLRRPGPALTWWKVLVPTTCLMTVCGLCVTTSSSFISTNVLTKMRKCIHRIDLKYMKNYVFITGYNLKQKQYTF